MMILQILKDMSEIELKIEEIPQAYVGKGQLL
jgi:hypothetical protein